MPQLNAAPEEKPPVEQSSPVEQPAARMRAQLVVPKGGLQFVTPEGRVLGGLYPTQNDTGGGVVFALAGPDGVEKVHLLAGRNYAAVQVSSAQSKAEAKLWAAQDRAVAHFHNTQGEMGAAISGGDAQYPGGSVSVGDGGANLAALMTGTPGGGMMRVYAPGTPSPMASLEALPEGGGAVHTFTQEGQPAAMLGANTGEGILALHGTDGQITFALPANRLPGYKHAPTAQTASEAEAP